MRYWYLFLFALIDDEDEPPILIGPDDSDY